MNPSPSPGEHHACTIDLEPRPHANPHSPRAGDHPGRLAGKAERFANVRRNLIVVRLACCCGLRVSEIAGLQLDDVVVDVQRPHLRLRRQITKGKKARCVPLWWDAGTLEDLVAWKQQRMKDGARGTDP